MWKIVRNSHRNVAIFLYKNIFKMKKDKKLTINIKKVLTKIKKRGNIINVEQRIRFINSKI